MLLFGQEKGFNPGMISGCGLWLDASDPNSITKAYQNITPTGSGTSGTTTITASATVAALVPIGAIIRIGGTDTYTVSNVVTTTITTVETLTATYNAGSALALDKISQINDKSGNGRNATQATAANQYVYIPNYQNGKSVAASLQVNGYMDVGSLALGSEFTIVSIVKLYLSIAGGGAFRRMIRMDNDNSGQFIRQTGVAFEMKAAMDGGPTNAQAPVVYSYDNTGYGVLISNVNLSTRTNTLQNGLTTTSANSGGTASGFTTPTQNWQIGDSTGSTSPSYLLYEQLFYNRFLTTAENNQLLLYANNKWR